MQIPLSIASQRISHSLVNSLHIQLKTKARANRSKGLDRFVTLPQTNDFEAPF
jgi:hypothetical protein